MLKKLFYLIVIIAAAQWAWNDPEIREEITYEVGRLFDDSLEKARENTQKFAAISAKQIQNTVMRGLTSLDDQEFTYLENLTTDAKAVLEFEKQWCGNSHLHPVLSDDHKAIVCKRIESIKLQLDLK